VDILFAFTGRDRDPETGLQYHRARYYDPTPGRWLSEDPIGFAARDANLRRYVHNDPIAFRDPSGLDESHYEGYWNEVGATAKGYFWNGPANLVGGLYNALRHPIQTAQGIGFAFRHPIITGQHLYNDLVDKLQTSEGQGEVAFDIALTVCTLGGTAGANAAGKTGKVVNLVDDAARSADKATDAARPAGNGSKTRTPAGPRPSYPVPRTPAKAAESPGPGWEWRGQQPVGGEKGAWFRPATGETLHPDLGHSAPVGPHWDWRAPDGTFWRLFPDGRVEPRP
jgi:RHS repeat-associated protein